MANLTEGVQIEHNGTIVITKELKDQTQLLLGVLWCKC